MSAPISLHPQQREAEGDGARARGWELFREEEKGRREIEKQMNMAACFLSSGDGEREGVTVDLGLSLLTCLGHKSPCVDVFCDFQTPGTKTGEFTEALPRLEALDVSHLVSEDRRAKDGVQSCCCEHATVSASDLLVKVYVCICNTLRNRTMK